MEYPVLSLSAASVGICEQGVTPFYDIVWSFDYYLEDITPETEFGFLFFLQNDTITPVNGTYGPGLGYSQGVDLSQYVRPDEDSTYYRPDEISTYNTNRESGLAGALLGVGFDSTGCFALSVTFNGNFIRDGKDDSDRIPNSVAMRGGAPQYSFNQYSVNYALTNFNIIDSVKKTVRARLGNLGRTIYIDYRYTPDQDFIPLLTQDINLGVGLYNYVRPGVTFTKNISSSSIASVPKVIVENFHFEGKTEIPVLDPGTNLPQLSVITEGPLLSAKPPEEPGGNGEPPTPPIFNDCPFRRVAVIYQDGSGAPGATVIVNGQQAGVTDSTGVILCPICDTFNILTAYKDNYRGTTEIIVNELIQEIKIILSEADNPVQPPPFTANILPSQINTAITTVNIISGFISSYDETGQLGPDVYNYGYAISATGYNDILFRQDYFAYRNLNGTLTLTLNNINDNWILTDSELNKLVGQVAHPVGTFVGTLSTINLSYYNE
jgi:hypothetical protein